MENILLIRLKSIGDVVLTLPAVNAVRENFSSAKITFLISKENAPLLQGFSEVNEVITLDRAALRSGNPFRVLPESLGLLRRLRIGKFSLVVDFQGYGETAWLARLTGAPERWGIVYGRGREWAYTRSVRRNENLLIADGHLDLLQRCGLKTGLVRNEFILPTKAMAESRQVFAANNLSETKPTLFIQPLTSSPQKDWPLENYLTLATYWRGRGVQVVFGGGPADRHRLEPARAAGFVIAAGTPLLVSAGLIKLSTVTIGGVTGLLHMAVAMQKRVVMLIGPISEPGFPYQHRDWGLTPTAGENISDIQIPAVIETCAKAFSAPADNVSCRS